MHQVARFFLITTLLTRLFHTPVAIFKSKLLNSCVGDGKCGHPGHAVTVTKTAFRTGLALGLSLHCDPDPLPLQCWVLPDGRSGVQV